MKTVSSIIHYWWIRIRTSRATARRSFVALSAGVRQIFAEMSKSEFPPYRAVIGRHVDFGCSMMLSLHDSTGRTIAVTFVKPRCRPASRNPCFRENVSKMTEGSRLSDDGSVFQSMIWHTNKDTKGDRQTKFRRSKSRRSPDIRQNVENGFRRVPSGS